jgi:hypothetical protein
MCLTSGRVSQVVPELCTVRHHLQRLFLPYVWQIFFARVVAKVLSYLQFEGWKTGAKNWTRWCGLPNKMRKCVPKGVDGTGMTCLSEPTHGFSVLESF